MPQEVSLQADVGSLGLQSLGAVSSILATLSADNVVPMALLQMEGLGSVFPVNGNLAETVKGLLQRCKDVRLDHFAFTIGWRKNDTASLMAASAGGQAIALLSVSLRNMFTEPDVGLILARLSTRLRPRTANISSAVQLADVAKLLAGKADAIGYGNHLAKEVTRLYDVYQALERPSPSGILSDMLTFESVTDILEKISQALSQENKICRISGIRAMGHIVGLVRALFPHDLVLTVEGVIIQDVESPKIRCEVVASDEDRPTLAYLETIVIKQASNILPIERLELRTESSSRDGIYSFRWNHWVADYLQLSFMDHGLICDHGFMQAFCNLLALLPASFHIKSTIWPIRNLNGGEISAISMLDLLGPLPRARISLICEAILGITPSYHHVDLQTAFATLLETITDAARSLSCKCKDNRCDWSEGWIDEAHQNRKRGKCARFQLWSAIGRGFTGGFCSFLIDAGPNVTMRPSGQVLSMAEILKIIKTNIASTLSPRDLFSDVFSVAGFSAPYSMWGAIIESSQSCTIYPTVLNTLELPSYQLVTFTLVEGQIVHEHRYHNFLRVPKAQPRPMAEQSLTDNIVPSHIGVHSGDPLLTIREAYDALEIHTSIQYAGSEVKLDLQRIFFGYFGLRWTSMCTHSVNTPMRLGGRGPIATSVASPAGAGRIGIAMTRRSPVAQFLCCEDGYQAVVQKDCCLDCAVKMFGGGNEGVVIVA